ncbi:hypothetical protein HS088_TW09G01062 [Tripterygium wilfordii]|uniref:Senescence domain-containing protein n=1 Tax=Tripterygium wilfordii TaxID=458696 RepID=A0A7J7D9F8_TRIWF|nr:senescence/dehydration-associated protein At4g35985, chloroplastic-like [Tripterygium wilfordii]KAF5743000.1 hypothetical protein HS088_TW09G01062 [Tripterygium wilfordii]
MGCFSSSGKRSKTASPMKYSASEVVIPSKQQNPESTNLKQEVLLQIPGCTVHLMDEGEALELAKGEFMVMKIMEESVCLATIIRVGNDLQWPLTKDEPVVKLDSLHYLFSLPMNDGDPLSYGVTFPEQYVSSLGSLDLFLIEHSCFTGPVSIRSREYVDWRDFAPKIEDYNNFLAKAIAGGSGHIVKGMFKCSNAYANQVHKGGEMILTGAEEQKNGVQAGVSNSAKSNGTGRKKTGINKTLNRVKKLSKMTEKLSKTMLNGVGVVTGSVITPVIKSQAGKAFLTMVPGEVLLASLDAVNRIVDAAEAAEKQAFSATSSATTRMVSNRFGENAGEATEDVLATAGHCANTAWNVFKIRKAFNPTSSVSSGVLKNADNNRNKRI